MEDAIKQKERMWFFSDFYASCTCSALKTFDWLMTSFSISDWLKYF